MERLATASLLGILIAFPAFAQDGETETATEAEEAIGAFDAFDREPERCITASRIDRTEVIDARTIVFHMRGRDAYVNRLTNDCPRLVTQRRFSYDVRTNRLCNVDTIFVLERWGSGISRGMPCGLGEFYPITEEEAELLDADPAEMLEDEALIEETSETAETATE